MTASDRFSQLGTRVRTALALSVPLILLLVAASYSPVMKVVLASGFAAALFVCCYEFARCCTREIPGKERGILYFSSLLAAPLATAITGLTVAPLYGAFGPLFLYPSILLGSLGLAFALAVVTLVRVSSSSLEEGTIVSRELFLGVLHVGLGGGALVALVFASATVRPLLWLLLSVIATDVGAYFIGSQLKGPLLARIISPKKTISGAIGGIASALVVGTVAGVILFPETGYPLICGGSMLMGLLSQAGDLAKSFIKRVHRVKDMGTVLPGHGGFLDRLDGILAAAPLPLALVLAEVLG